MEILFRHSWLLFIAVTVVNALVLRYRSKEYIAQNPALGIGYDQFFKGMLFYGNIPWVIMMMGDLSGMTQGSFEYFNPKAMNLMVLAFHLSIIVLWILSARWIYFKNGAEFIENHPGLLRSSSYHGSKNTTAKQIKLFFLLMLLGGIMAMIGMWT